MKWLRKYEHLLEDAQQTTEKDYQKIAKNLVKEICISMCLLNNSFLDDILDKGLKARYTNNSNIFLTDLKNLLIEKNRLCLGKFNDSDVCENDEETSKINQVFSFVSFDIEKDWDILISSRVTARNIQDKLFSNKKLTSEDILKIYWIGCNKDKDNDCDIVIETTDNKQYDLYLDKNLSTQKSASFNTFAEDLIGTNIDKLYVGDYLNYWNELTRDWVNIIYTNANKEVQQMIEKFVDYNRINDITYENYYDITIKDKQYQYLGEYMPLLNKNEKTLSNLLADIWKNREKCFAKPSDVYKKWENTKIILLNSKILENLLTTSLETNNQEDIVKVDNKWKEANGTVKMKLIKTLVEKMGCSEKDVYYLSKNGDTFLVCPSRMFFRTNYDNIGIKFDYHVNLTVDTENKDNNDFNIDIEVGLNNYLFMRMFIIVGFSSNEMSGKLTAKYKFELPSQFNYMLNILGEKE